MIDLNLRRKLMNFARNNDEEGIKEVLTELNLRKSPDALQNIYGKFMYLGQCLLGERGDFKDYEDILIDLLIFAVKNNNVELCKYLVESKELRVNTDVNHSTLWIHCLSTGQIEPIKYLANSPKAKNKDKASSIITGLGLYISNGLNKENLDILKYLIDDPTMDLHKDIVQKLKESNPPDGILNRFNIFINVCANDNIPAVDFLLEHKYYRQMISGVGFINGLEVACHRNKREMVEHLLNDKKMPFKPFDDYDPSFLLQVATRQGAVDILQYLIFNFNLPKPEDLDDFLNVDKIAIITNNPGFTTDSKEKIIKTIKIVNDMFEKRELMENLGTNLGVNPTNNKPKRKI